MGQKFQNWLALSDDKPNSLNDIANIVRANRSFEAIDKLEYGDHGLHEVLDCIHEAILKNRRIALYADYDVDGTMSCVSWIWFFQAIGFKNFIHYIPCRFKEGYGVNLDAMKHLIHSEHAELIITMDTGITANIEAEYCRTHNVQFICTDHHKIQPQKMPDCLILNPKLHPNLNYQELCGCGITFVLLRKLAQHVSLAANHPVWTDILALTGMATICDVVPLNGVNHKLAKMGVDALMRSQRPVLAKLRTAAMVEDGDEKDVGFRLGPRINAVGRLEHADVVIKAFVDEDPSSLIHQMGACNERRKKIQSSIVDEARVAAANAGDDAIFFLGGDWHPGVVGIAASKITEEYWRPTWLFQKKDGICKGSARSIKGFDVTDAMSSCKELFTKFGGHAAAGGFLFPEENESAIRAALIQYAEDIKSTKPHLWQSQIDYDCSLSSDLLNLKLTDLLDSLKPFGHGFTEPRFRLTSEIQDIRFFNDKITGKPRHTSITLNSNNKPTKLMFFGAVLDDVKPGDTANFIVSASRNHFRGQVSLQLSGHDYEVLS